MSSAATGARCPRTSRTRATRWPCWSCSCSSCSSRSRPARSARSGGRTSPPACQVRLPAPRRPPPRPGTALARTARVADQPHQLASEGSAAAEPAWHHTAAVYQVYLRSFADGGGDGIGDLAGLAARLPYLRDLGVDAIWLTPWYVSPMADCGYDVADYRDIDPVFGTLTEAGELIRAVHDRGLKIIIDIVPNHCSDQHRWFRAAVAAGPGTPERARFWFRPGRGESGELPPNDWPSMFGGPAWTRITEADGRPGEWYLHLYA